MLSLVKEKYKFTIYLYTFAYFYQKKKKPWENNLETNKNGFIGWDGQNDGGDRNGNGVSLKIVGIILTLMT